MLAILVTMVVTVKTLDPRSVVNARPIGKVVRVMNQQMSVDQVRV